MRHRMKKSSDNKQDKGIEREERRVKQKEGRETQRYKKNTERKRTPGNRPQKLWGKQIWIQMRKSSWKRKIQQWAAGQRQRMKKRRGTGSGSRTQE